MRKYGNYIILETKILRDYTYCVNSTSRFSSDVDSQFHMVADYAKCVCQDTAEGPRNYSRWGID